MYLESKTGERFRIKEGTSSIGRVDDNDIVLPDGRVSRSHAQITYERGICTVTDLNSTNWTLVNGRRITGSIEIADGDEITFADTTVILRLKEAIPTPPPNLYSPEPPTPAKPITDTSAAPPPPRAKSTMPLEIPDEAKTSAAKAEKKPQDAAVTFDHTEVKPAMMGSIQYTYHIYKGPNESAAREFLQKNPITENYLYIIVETPEGNFGRDVQGIFRE